MQKLCPQTCLGKGNDDPRMGLPAGKHQHPDFQKSMTRKHGTEATAAMMAVELSKNLVRTLFFASLLAVQ